MNKHIKAIDITQESVDEFLRPPEIKRLLKVFKHIMNGHSGGTAKLESRRGGRDD